MRGKKGRRDGVITTFALIAAAPTAFAIIGQLLGHMPGLAFLASGLAGVLRSAPFGGGCFVADLPAGARVMLGGSLAGKLSSRLASSLSSIAGVVPLRGGVYGAGCWLIDFSVMVGSISRHLDLATSGRFSARLSRTGPLAIFSGEGAVF